MKKRATGQPAEPVLEPDILQREDEDDDEVEDERATWMGSRETRRKRAEMMLTARGLVKTIVLKAQHSVDQELAFLAGRLAQLDASLITFGGKSIFAEQEKKS